MMSEGDIKVLITDDSFFTRKLMSEIIKEDDSITLVGEARNGAEAVEKVRQLKPDVVLMDYEMPVMNGTEAIKNIMAGEHRPSIVVVSAYTAEGSIEAFESLRAGAVDFIQKPSGEVSVDILDIKEEVLEKIHQFSRLKNKVFRIKKRDITKYSKKQVEKFNVIALGASTGGPQLMEEVILNLPRKIKGTLVIFQHLPKQFTTSFARRVSEKTKHKVLEIEDGMRVEPGVVYIAPGDHNTSVQKLGDSFVFDVVEVGESKEAHPSIDVGFSGVAEAFKEKALSILFTGMGKDGTLGIQDVKKNGGRVIIQDPDTAVVSSMPESGIETGVYDEIMKPEEIIGYINKAI